MWSADRARRHAQADQGQTICPDPLVPSSHQDAVLFELALTQSSWNTGMHVRTKLRNEDGCGMNDVRMWALIDLMSLVSE